MKKILCFSIIFALVLGLFGCSSAPTGKVVLLDDKGAPLATVTTFDFQKEGLLNPAYAPYVSLALAHGVNALMETKSLTEEQAKEELMVGNYTLHTAFSSAVFTSVSVMAGANPDLGLGVAVTDLKGHIVCAYGDYATYQTAPHSALKPLSVYAPLVEQNKGGWNSIFEDSPYNKVDGEDWPQNANGQYTYKNMMLYEGVAHSVNTMAVKALRELGTASSIAFLEDSFGLDLNGEKILLKEQDGALGNLALGSLMKGVTPVNMAGYYQIFGNEGKYIAPNTLLQITQGEQAVWENNTTPKQVISYETAYLMNKLLEGVVTFGTGKEAKVAGIPVVGKTGTGRYEKTYDNWFVGVTPAYCVAVYHNYHKEGNIAPRLFGNALMGFPQGEKTLFPTCSTVKTAVFCTATGKAWTPKCAGMTKGYAKGSVPVCDGCDATAR